MPSAQYAFSRIPAAPLPRSSHSLVVIGRKAYIYGGEINPREPVDGLVYSIDIDSGEYEVIEGKGDVPQPRVGHTAVACQEGMYVFGGRGGPAMTPLLESGAIHHFSPSSNTWTRITPPPSVPFPCARSYHASTPLPNGLLVHAGCGDKATGRLRDTWYFDFTSKTWTQLEDAPGDPRGGTAVVFDMERRGVWRFGGFNGKVEMGGGIDFLRLNLGEEGIQQGEKGVWETRSFGEGNGASGDGVLAKGPGPRSVTALHVLNGKVLTVFGEGNPSPTGGHDSAGNFYGDVWAYDAGSGEWEEIPVESQDGGPGERGWFGSDCSDGGMVVWGGLDAGNERVGDGWVLRMV